uniref:Metaxin-2 n=1 Tax=Glossina brevipalpis TaxID=37001 RepID=A0A1A9W1R2_9MUSC
MSEPWPDDAVLYQPFEDKQILLPEKASCSAVKAYLKMCNLPCQVRGCANAEFMSPGGRMTKLPVLKAGNYILAEFEPIANFIEQKKAGIGNWMNEHQKEEMHSYVSETENVFTMAEFYFSFKLKVVYDKVTAPRNGCVFPWPLNKIQNFSKSREAKKILKVYQWADMNLDDVIEKVNTCCKTLELQLEESLGPYFYGERPCELDAVVFGHLFSVLTINLPDNTLAQIVGQYKLLLHRVLKMDTLIGLGINYYMAMPLLDNDDMEILSLHL